MLTIRFARVGKKNQPQFKIMLQEHTIAPGGTHVEILGSYDPRSKQAVLKEDRIKYWISQGAKVSDTAYNLFLKKGVLTGEKRKVKIPAKKVEPAPTEVTADKPAPTEVKADKEVPAEVAAPEIPKAEAKPEEKKAEAPKAEVAAPVAEIKEPARNASAEADAGGEEKAKEEAPKPEEKKEAAKAG